MSFKFLKTVLVLLDPGLEPFRGILQGLATASSKAEGISWHYHHPSEPLDDLLEEIYPDLSICSVRNSDEALFFRSMGVPVLNVMSSYRVPDLPSIDVSKESLCQAIFTFLSLKSSDHLHWMDDSELGKERLEVLKEGVLERKMQIIVEDKFDKSILGHGGKLIKNHLLVFGSDLSASAFLKENPTLAGMRIGILGLGNDSLLCLRSRPSISSISLKGISCGEEMVSLVDKMLTGLDTGLAPMEVMVGEVFERDSTSWMKSGDNRIKKAMVYFRDNMHLGHNVEELSRHSQMSYRTFHRLFCEETGMSPKSWMDREQFEKAKFLLANESDPLSKIATYCGYSDDKALIRAFRRLARKPPSAFRSISS